VAGARHLDIRHQVRNQYAPLWLPGRKRLGPDLRVARRARHAPNVSHAADVVLGEQRVELVERVRRVAHGEYAHRWD
jgi:hypothetical protein